MAGKGKAKSDKGTAPGTRHLSFVPFPLSLDTRSTDWPCVHRPRGVAVLPVVRLRHLSRHILEGGTRRLDRSVFHQLPAGALVSQRFDTQRSVLSSDVLSGAEDAGLFTQPDPVCALLCGGPALLSSISGVFAQPAARH